jgi:hypothetical protein
MLFMDFVFALIVALLLVVIFAVIFDIRPPGFGVAAFFVIVFLASWAGGIWLTPPGPVNWGSYWLPFLLVGVMVALLMAAVRTPPPEESSIELVDRRKRKARRWAAATTLSIFFWILVGMLLLAIVNRYTPLI